MGLMCSPQVKAVRQLCTHFGGCDRNEQKKTHLEDELVNRPEPTYGMSDGPVVGYVLLR